MIDQKIISKLQNYYLSDPVFRYVCRNFTHHRISSLNFLSEFALFSDLQITQENLFCFLSGIKNCIDLYNDSESLSNSYYSAGKKVSQKVQEKTYVANVLYFSQRLVCDISDYDSDNENQTKNSLLKMYFKLIKIIEENKNNIGVQTLTDAQETLKETEAMMSGKGWMK